MNRSIFALGLIASLPLLAVAQPPTQDILTGPPLNELPNFPLGYDIIEGNPPGHIRHWIRYVIVELRNHPFPIVFFSPKEFKPKTSLEMLIVLSGSEYKTLSAFTRPQPCRKLQPPNNDPWQGGEITEHDGRETTRCGLLESDACNYLAKIADLPEIARSPARLDLMHRIAMETNCKAGDPASSP